jgi:hypothetical protein
MRRKMYTCVFRKLLWIDEHATENVIPSRESYYTWKLGPASKLYLFTNW